MKDAYVGDLSAIMIDNMPFWSNMVTVPEKKTALLHDWEMKLDKIIEESLKSKLTGLAGVPSWMMMLMKEVLKKTGKENILQVWPDLEVFFHGGVSFIPYKEEYKKLFPSKDFHYMEIYNASEGFFALQDKKEPGELLLMLDYGIFYEFIPMKDFKGKDSTNIVSLSQVETGINYAMVISTNSGLWRYIIGDTVQFTSVKPYRIKITGRTKHYINVFGEEVVIENTDKAIEEAARQTGASVTEYTVAPVYMETDKKGAHEWMIEFETPPADFERFKKILDQSLQELNSDYEAKRYNDLTLDFPIIHQARKGLFYQWLKQKGKLGGQNKVPRLSNKRDFIEELLRLNGEE
jgi:phenylacetate-coenzyme A ligase PaaK-like adenylate-forming protein